ncbi:MAG: VPLPA-CTERM sorting domain-containing protein [Gammaproteobacteria bacterium]|nr:VPLPA-CTERM sorting domain-containing protein [Gammaproteobacteria bacterium]
MKQRLVLVLFLLLNITPFGSAEAATVVIASDDWIFTNTGFSSRPVDTANFARNLAEYLTGGPGSKIHAYSSFQSLAQSSLVNTLTNAGYDYSTGTGITFDIQTLSQYDALFFGSDSLSQSQEGILTEYVNNGGGVYIHGGLGMNNPGGVAAAWNDFLSQYDIGFGTNFIGLGGATTISSTHPLFDGVSSLYMLNGHAIMGNNVIATTSGGTPLFAAASTVPIPAALWLFASGLLGLVGIIRKRTV